MDTMKTLENAFVRLVLDETGRLTGLKNKQTGTELIGNQSAAAGWRMVIPAGGHRVDFVDSAGQTPSAIELTRHGRQQRLSLHYRQLLLPGGPVPIEAAFTFALDDDSPVIEAWAEIDNRSERAIDEVEFPIVGGLTGFDLDGGKRGVDMIVATDRGRFFNDVLNGLLPNTGPESFDFGREHESAMFEPDAWGNLWLELYGEHEGLYLFCHRVSTPDVGMIMERFPTLAPQDPSVYPWRGDAHVYPPGTPRWLRWIAVHAPRIASGRKWTSDHVTIMPHKGDWHAGADQYSAYRHKGVQPAQPPAWMQDFVGWGVVVGYTYLNQTFNNFEQCAQAAIADQAATGMNLVFYYGHTQLGCEGADFDWSPAEHMGGEPAFRAMLDELHSHGIRVMLLDHLHRYINRDVPEYKALNLERHAVRDAAGNLVTARWGKETFLSYRRSAGPTPTWIEMCPSSKEWLDIYLKHVTHMIELGVDGLEFDCFYFTPCFNPAHKHQPGSTWEYKLKFTRAVREHAKRLNPDFVLFCEPYHSWEAVEVMDAFFPGDRFCHEHGRIFRYMFPELHLQTVKVTNYDYDSVNKALSLGIGVDTEICGGRHSVSQACPELAAYIGEVNRFRRRYPDVLMHGTFRDNIGIRVSGTPHAHVLESTRGERALIVRNATSEKIMVKAAFDDPKGQRLSIWRPGQTEQPVALPADIPLPPFGVAVILALKQSGKQGK
jgi:hypothetical protein